jgi:predicted GNAT family acetyltransferase
MGAWGEGVLFYGKSSKQVFLWMVCRRSVRVAPIAAKIGLYISVHTETTMTNSELGNLKIVNNESDQRWEAHVDQLLAVAEYRRRENAIFFIHTEVPHALKGQGIASRLIQVALEDARTRHLAVIPFCPFVAGYIRRHPDDKAIVHPDYLDLVEAEAPSRANG